MLPLPAARWQTLSMVEAGKKGRSPEAGSGFRSDLQCRLFHIGPLSPELPLQEPCISLPAIGGGEGGVPGMATPSQRRSVSSLEVFAASLFIFSALVVTSMLDLLPLNPSSFTSLISVTVSHFKLKLPCLISTSD